MKSGTTTGRLVAALEKAESVWPGELDWQLMFRKAHCLVRMKADGQADEARVACGRRRSNA